VQTLGATIPIAIGKFKDASKAFLCLDPSTSLEAAVEAIANELSRQNKLQVAA
jgi:hypothetical protein